MSQKETQNHSHYFHTQLQGRGDVSAPQIKRLHVKESLEMWGLCSGRRAAIVGAFELT